MAYYRTPSVSNDRNLRAYITGLAIGDGNLSLVRKTVRLRISCDNAYPNLILRISKTLQALLPENKVGLVKKFGNCTDVYVYSNQLEKLLGWKAAKGSKFKQNVTTPAWIKKSKEYKINYLRGLIETDGAIYRDRGYLMVIFTTIIEDLALEVNDFIKNLGFKSKLYKLKPNPKSVFKQQDFYHVRLSKDVQKFLDLVRPDKS